MTLPFLLRTDCAALNLPLAHPRPALVATMGGGSLSATPNIKMPVVAMVLACALFTTAASIDPVVVNGSGASFPALTYRGWIDAFVASRPDLASKYKITYDSVGSDKGRVAMFNGRVIFGASDAPISADESALYPRMRMIPTIAGSIALAYNIESVSASSSKRLVLSRAAIFGIFSGSITYWNDTVLTSLNPTLGLPAAPIVVIVRSDGSGTSESFLRALNKFNNSTGVFADKVTTQFPKYLVPSSIGASRNTGVAATISSVPNSIGYLDSSVSSDNLCNAQLPTALVINSHGNAVEANRSNVINALEGTSHLFQNTSYLFAPIVDSAGNFSYPMALITSIIVSLEYPADLYDATVGLVTFILWVYGSDVADYVTTQTKTVIVPESIRAKAKEVLMSIMCGNRTVYNAAVLELEGLKVSGYASSKNYLGVGVGVGVGGFVVIATTLLLIYRYRKMKSIGGKETSWVIDFKELKIEKRVGEGSFGNVYLARWRGAIVAVKTISSQELSLAEGSISSRLSSGKISEAKSKDTMPRESIGKAAAFRGNNKNVYRTICTKSIGGSNASTVGQTKGSKSSKSKATKTERRRVMEDIVEFKKEIKTMVQLRHPNIVIFMGACLHPNNLCIVTEFMARGSLLDLFDQPDVVFDWPLRLSFALGASKGMEYLHSGTPPILHLDLKSPNLLVDEFMRLKVADFGLAAMKNDKQFSKASNLCLGSVLWMAPEMATGSKPVSEKCDVYSFGIILWELLARSLPYQDELMHISTDALLDQISLNVLRPSPIPGGCDSFTIVMQQCWAQDPDERPAFEHVSEMLSGMDPDSFAKPNWRAGESLDTNRHVEVSVGDEDDTMVDAFAGQMSNELFTKVLRSISST
eukprot:Opistho-2@36725